MSARPDGASCRAPCWGPRSPRATRPETPRDDPSSSPRHEHIEPGFQGHWISISITCRCGASQPPFRRGDQRRPPPLTVRPGSPRTRMTLLTAYTVETGAEGLHRLLWVDRDRTITRARPLQDLQPDTIQNGSTDSGTTRSGPLLPTVTHAVNLLTAGARVMASTKWRLEIDTAKWWLPGNWISNRFLPEVGGRNQAASTDLNRFRTGEWPARVASNSPTPLRADCLHGSRQRTECAPAAHTRQRKGTWRPTRFANPARWADRSAP